MYTVHTIFQHDRESRRSGVAGSQSQVWIRVRVAETMTCDMTFFDIYHDATGVILCHLTLCPFKSLHMHFDQWTSSDAITKLGLENSNCAPPTGLDKGTNQVKVRLDFLHHDSHRLRWILGKW